MHSSFIIYNTIYPVYIAFLSACLELFFQECLQKDMILDWYYRWLHQLYENGYRKISFLLGYCPFCHGFWVFAFFYYITGCPVSLIFFLYAGINHIFIKIMLKKFVN